MRVHKVLFTPEVAQKFLEKSANPRPLNDGTVKGYISEMRRGDWRGDNGEMIKRDEEGNVVDGQHRLTAVVRGGFTVEMWVLEGAPSDAVLTLDCGRKRGLHEILGTKGEKYPHEIAAIIHMQHKCDTRKFNPNTNESTKASMSMLWRMFEKQKGKWREAAALSKKINKFLRPSAGGYLYLKFCEKDKTMALQFFEALQTGAGLCESDVMLKLRDKLLRAKLDGLTQEELMALTIKTWNAWRDGRKVTRLNYVASGPKREEFPEIR
jgi:hypothetical protein